MLNKLNPLYVQASSDLMATKKTTGGSYQLSCDYNDEIVITVNGEVLHEEKLEADMDISFYMKRRNKPFN